MRQKFKVDWELPEGMRLVSISWQPFAKHWIVCLAEMAEGQPMGTRYCSQEDPDVEVAFDRAKRFLEAPRGALLKMEDLF